MKHVFSSLAVALLSGLAPTAAFACDEQAGSVIFEDSFPDDSGGWDMYEGLAITPPEFVLSIPATWTANSTLNTTFNATEGDYCLQFRMPPSPAADNSVGVGLYVLASDYKNLFLFEGYSSGICGLYRKTDNNWTTVFTQNDCGLQTAPDAVNTLRVMVKDGRLTEFVNGKQVKSVRAQIPTVPQKFGFYAQLDKTLDKQVDVKVTRFRVTTGQ